MKLAQPKSLLGQLQRGRGVGFIGCIELPRRRAHALVAKTLREDPWPNLYQETRAHYYAQLILRTRFDIGHVGGILRGLSKRSVDPDYLIDTLGALAKRGEGEAVEALKAHLATATAWGPAFKQLEAAGKKLLTGVETILEARYPKDDDLFKQVGLMLYSPPEPWKVGIDPESRLGRALSHAVQQTRRSRDRAAEFETMSTEALLASVEGSTYSDIGRTLAARRADADRLLEASHSGPIYRRLASVQALGKQKDPRTLEPATALLDVEKHGRTPQIVAAFALIDLPGDLVLPRARRWFRSHKPGHRYAGHTILSLCATAEDAALLGSELPAAHRQTDTDRLTDILEGLQRAGKGAPVARLRGVYAQTHSSYARMLAVELLARDDERFREMFAIECLWDCEDRSRIAGIEHAPISAPGVRERLNEISADRFEERHVRDAAGRRHAEQACTSR